jgi:hypothetical protein
MTPDDTSRDLLQPDDTRRDFLRKTAIGAMVAGGAWVAPAVLTLDAARAAGTCPTGTATFAWSSGGDGVRHTAGTNPLVGTIDGVDIRIINTTSTSVAGAGLIGDNWMTRNSPQAAGCPPTVNCGSAATTNFPRGNATSFYSLLMNDTTTCNNCNPGSGTANRSSEVTFGFFVAGSTTKAQPVRSLAFSLYDIDSASGEYQDQVQVFINGSTTEATLGAGGNATATLAVAGATSTIQNPLAATAIFKAKANSSAAASSQNGNVNLQFNSTNSITTVRVRFQDISGGPTTVQWVGIGDLSFCKFLG